MSKMTTCDSSGRERDEYSMASAPLSRASSENNHVGDASREASPTWLFSDEARDKGADAMLYSSRSRPELSHVVIFDTACLSYIGPITTFEKDEEFSASKGLGNTDI